MRQCYAFERAINPISQTNWEGVGVEPRREGSFRPGAIDRTEAGRRKTRLEITSKRVNKSIGVRVIRNSPERSTTSTDNPVSQGLGRGAGTLARVFAAEFPQGHNRSARR